MCVSLGSATILLYGFSYTPSKAVTYVWQATVWPTIYAKQQNSKTAKQQNSKTAKQQNSKTAKQQSAVGSRQISLGGFTLVELLVAVAILAILAVAATPSMTRIVARYRLTAAADEVITLMRYGQSEAKMRGETVTLLISNNELTVGAGKDGSEALRHIDISSRLSVTPSGSLAGDSIAFLSNGQIRPSSKVSGRLDDASKGMLLLCSTRLADDQNAVAIRFSGAELRRQEHGAGSACNTFPP